MTTAPSTIDLTGLPASVVRDIQRLVETLRGNLPASAAIAQRPLRGRFAESGLGIGGAEIDEAQREIWSGFPREFPAPSTEE